MDMFLARQPIFNRELFVEGYALFYRTEDARQNIATIDGNLASSRLIDQSLLSLDFNKLVSQKKGYINFTEQLIIDEVPLIFDKDRIVVVIPEIINLSEALLGALKKLKDLGYMIALDDLVVLQQGQALNDYAHIIKVDFLNSTHVERVQLTKQLKGSRVKLLAEKVETREAFDEAVRLGYDLFQGFFFAKPDTVKSKTIVPLATTYLRLYKELSKKEPDFHTLCTAIEADVALSYKLLKLINSPAFYRRTKISSINQAIVLLGMRELQKWITLLMLQDSGSGKPDELVRTVLIRGKLMELLSKAVNVGAESNMCFLTGMLSLIDVLTDRPLDEVLMELSLGDGIIDAIVDRKNRLGHLLDMVEGYEQSVPDLMNRGAQALNYDALELPLMYFEAMEWADAIMSEEENIN